MAGFSRPLFALLCLAAALPAAASTFNISPIRAELSPARHMEVLTLTNADDEPVVVQVHVVAWSQKNGEEQLDETRELLATPPVLQIPAKGEQIVRVALRRDPDATGELTYRIIFEEVPQAAPLNFTGLRVALRLSVPVFVAPTHGKPAPQLSWEVHPKDNGEFEVAATNSGSAHLQVSDFELKLAGGSNPLHGMTSKYVLPGSRMVWLVKPNGGDGSPGNGSQGHGSPGNGASSPASLGAPLVIHGHSDQGEFTADVAPSSL